MLFTSLNYYLFLLVSVLVYWRMGEKYRKFFLVAASYTFYCSWRPEYGLLLLWVTVFNYTFGKYLKDNPRRAVLTAGVIVNLIPLLYFKYLTFLLGNVDFTLSFFGAHIRIPEIYLPLGISFFTFQALCYLIEIYGGEDPFGSLLDFAVYKALWPQLIAGPIVRPEQMIGQLSTVKVFRFEEYSAGMQRILQGVFKKLVLADRLAPIVEDIFRSTHASVGWIDVVAGSFGFGLQVYFDFSAYSDIAIGSARLLGYVLPENFDLPYRSASFSEFWSKWHMTLSSWIRDYVYLPLAMASGGGKSRLMALTLLAMLVMGFWHGANWTFALWGLWHGALLVIQNTVGRKFFNNPRGFRRAVAMLVTYVAVNIGFLFFRAESIDQVWRMLKALATFAGGARPLVTSRENLFVVGLFILGLAGYTSLHLMAGKYLRKVAEPFARIKWAHTVGYATSILVIVLMGMDSQKFIYFQF